MSVQAQWNLDYSIGSALSIGLGVLRAATRDNVQPLAIIACEKFGNTIAMCPDTCRKVEHAMMTPDPVPVRFLRGTVGFFADDCGSQLSKSLAGVQFLGLATALVTSMGPFQSANVLEQLLKQSSSDRTLLPTARQLKGLLEAIEPRCHSSGFGNSVVGWRLFLHGNDLLHSVDQGSKAAWNEGKYFPSHEGIESLVNALRQIARIGDAKNTVLSIYARLCVPWVLSFISWCLGTPPTIVLDGDEATTILDSPESRVLVYIQSKRSFYEDFGVHISSSLRDITRIIRPSEVLSDWRQMMSIENYGKIRLAQMELDSGSGYRALCQAVPYCIQMVLKDSRDFWFSANANKDLPAGSRLEPLPRVSVILEMASRILGTAKPLLPVSVGDYLTVLDLSIVKVHIETLESDCECGNCNSKGLLKSGHIYKSCSNVPFLLRLGSLVAEIIALSLFNNAESLLVRLISTMGISTGNMFASRVSEIIQGLQSPGFPTLTSDLLHLALDLCGHFSSDQNPDIQRRWLMSSQRGQVVYLSILETLQIDEDGFLMLDWLPGRIQYDGIVHDLALTPEDMYYGTDRSSKLNNVSVITSADFTTYSSTWWVEEQDRHLEISIGALDKWLTHLKRSPYEIINKLPWVLVLRDCPHDPDSPLSEPDPLSTYTLPLGPCLKMKDKPGHVRVVAVAGNKKMRFLGLSAFHKGEFIVVRVHACLSCCLKFCRSLGVDALIL